MFELCAVAITDTMTLEVRPSLIRQVYGGS